MMQYRKGIAISICILFVITISFALSAYAEVKSLKTDKSFYIKGSTIIFSGLVDKNDFHKQVNLVIHDPQNNFVGISGGFSDDDNKFEVMVKTTDPQFHDRFSVKGTYNATAFITVEKNGTVVSFDFSPDGTSVVHPQTTTEPAPNAEPKPQVQDTSGGQAQTDLTQKTSDSEKSVQERIQERIEMAKKQREALTKPPVQTAPAEKTTVNQTTNDNVVNNTVSKPVSQTEEKPVTTNLNPDQFFPSSDSFVYAIAGIVGAGVIMAVIYRVKNKNKNKTKDKPEEKHEEKIETIQKTIPQPEEQYPLMILKNRLAKGEITIEEFNELKDALKEP